MKSGVMKSGVAREVVVADPELIDSGQAETRTLGEGLKVDFARLAASLDGMSASDVARIAEWKAVGVLRRMVLVADLLSARFGHDFGLRLATHRSDTIRGWAAYMLARDPAAGLAGALDALRPLADDPHFGVREWAWLAVRERIAADVEAAVGLLAPWAREPSERLRRFASEATRPRGVWCAHIRALRERPEMGLPILEPLAADPSRYVQDSVSNWLNDAAKDRPEWVRDLCARWSGLSPCRETARIVKRATRSLSRAPSAGKRGKARGQGA